MKYKALVLSAVATILLILITVVVCITGYVSNYNYGNVMEKRILATWENNENILASYSLKIGEMAQVTGMYQADLKSVFSEAMSGRYGDGGSKAMWQWLKEQNPQLDPSLYTRLQQVMESGRNEFKLGQTQLVDLKRSYEQALGYLWQGTWLRIAGYPTIDLNKYKIISSKHAQSTFESGVDHGIQLRR